MANSNKMRIIIGTGHGRHFRFNDRDSSCVVEVNFNPTEYSIDKSISFTATDNPGLESSIIQFSHGAAALTKMELLFDTYGSEKKVSVYTKYVSKLERLTRIDSELHAPPPCKIQWGYLNFVGVVEKMSKKYTLFSSDGVPLRAKVTLELKEYVPLRLQAKASPLMSPDRRKIYEVREGDSLWQFATKAYGEPGLWRVIADANKIDNPKNLEIGNLLIIPVLKEKEVRYDD